jgi:hypothetical protein
MKIAAMESTTSDLVNTIKNHNNINKLDISKKTILKLKDLLQVADLVKFAKSKPFATEIEMHRNYADVILEGLKFEDETEVEIESEVEVENEVEIENKFAPKNNTDNVKKENDAE